MNNSKTEIKNFTVRRGGIDYQLTARKVYVDLYVTMIELGGNKVLISKVPSGLTLNDLHRARSFALECWDSHYNAIDLDEHDAFDDAMLSALELENTPPSTLRNAL